MPHYKPMRRVLGKLGALKFRVYLGAYDASMEIPKPLQVWTNARFGNRLCRLRPDGPADPSGRYYNKGPCGDYTGTRGLQSTGSYPLAFGKAVVEAYMAALPRIQRQLQHPLEAGCISCNI